MTKTRKRIGHTVLLKKADMVKSPDYSEMVALANALAPGECIKGFPFNLAWPPNHGRGQKSYDILLRNGDWRVANVFDHNVKCLSEAYWRSLDGKKRWWKRDVVAWREKLKKED